MTGFFSAGSLRKGRAACAALGLAAVLAPSPGPPRAQEPGPTPAAAPDPALQAARAAFEALPEAERRALQEALVWTGDHNGVTTGAFGRRTYEALLAHQRRVGDEANGLLPAAARRRLLASGEAARAAARFRVQIDPATGARLGVPEARLPKRGPAPGGSRWQSGDGRITLDTVAHPAGEADLAGLFAHASATRAGRKVTYKLSRPDFAVVTGETAGGRFYIRYAAGAEGIRGFTLSYDKALAGEVDRLAIAVANSFVPFPSAAPAAETVAREGDPAKAGDAKAAAASGAASGATAPAPAAGPATGLITGLRVGAGWVLTSGTALAGCPAPRIGAAPARVLRRDPDGDLALLADPVRGTETPLPVRAQAPAPGEALVAVAAHADGGLGIAPGEASGEGILAPLQPGAGGAPAFDREGRLVGLVAGFPEAPAQVAGVAVVRRHRLVPGQRVATFLGGEPDGGKVPGTERMLGGDGPPGMLGVAAARARAATVAIACGP